MSHEEAESQIAAFVDFQKARGAREARKVFPELWEHIKYCAECWELYQALKQLAELP